MAQKTLTAKVKFDTSSAERSLARLEKKINAINKVVNVKAGKSSIEKQTERAVLQQEKLRQATLKTQLAEERLTTQKHKTALAAQKVTNATEKSANSANKLATAFNRGNSNANGLLKTVKRLAATYLGVMGAKAVITTADTVTSAQNRLNNLEGGGPAKTDVIMDKVYAASQRSRSGYGDMLANVSKSMTLAGDAFQGDVDNAIRFQEIMSKAYTVGGASAAEASSSMYQLVQALGSGVLQGDELRSVREGAPIAYKAIEKFAQGVLDTKESLKDLASEGVITSDIIVAALMDKDFTSNLEKQFKKTKMTFAQSWTMFKNTATKAFEPVLEKLTEILNKITKSGAIDIIAGALVALADTVLWLMGVFGKFFNWCADNWEWLKTIVIGAVVAICGWLTYMAIKSIVNFILTNWVILLVVATLILLIYILYKLGYSTEEIIGGICGAFMFLGYLLWDIIVWTITIVYYAISIIWDACLAVGSVILDAIIAVGTGILLAIQGIMQLILWLITTVWGVLVTIYDVIYSVIKGIYGVFKIGIVGIYQLFVWLGQGVLGILLGIAKAIDWVFGSDLSSSVQGWMDGLGSSVDTLAEKLDPFGEFEDIGNQWKTSYGELGDMYAGRGKYDDLNITDNMGNLVSGAGNLITSINNGAESLALDPTMLDDWALNSTLNPMDGWDKGYKFGDDFAGGLGDFFGSFNNRLPDPNDEKYAVGGNYDPSGANDDILAALDKINGNTEDMKDAMDLTDDDLDYLRRLAEMEWRNEFTTAEIKVDMTNHNTVNGERDLDGIVSYLSDVLREEMTSVAYGVHY